MKLSIKMDRQGRIVIPKEIRKELDEEQTFKLDYIEDYVRKTFASQTYVQIASQYCTN